MWWHNSAEIVIAALKALLANTVLLSYFACSGALPVLGSKQACSHLLCFGLLVAPGDYALVFKPLTPSSTLESGRMNISIRKCAAGEVTRPGLPGGDLRYQCLPCGKGTYSFNPEGPGGAERQCTPCTLADHAYCDGAAKVPDLGFWHSHPRSDQVSWLHIAKQGYQNNIFGQTNNFQSGDVD